MGLRLKFNLMLVICYIVGLGLSTVAFYYVSQREAIEQLQSQTDVLRAEALAVRRYTSDEIGPLLADQSGVQFLPQTVPSFSAQTVFRNLREHFGFPQFFYKEAALSATNPSDKARDWERAIIEKLRNNADIEKDVSFRNIDNASYYTVAYPLTIKSESCLKCHSTPEKAPPSLLALYGNKNGFGWKLNETIGAQIFSVPTSVTDARVWRNLGLFVGVTSAIFLVLLLLLNVLLNRYVIGPVRRMAATAEAVSVGDASAAEFDQPGSDEVASLSRSFNRMRRSLDSAMKMIESEPGWPEGRQGQRQ